VPLVFGTILVWPGVRAAAATTLRADAEAAQRREIAAWVTLAQIQQRFPEKWEGTLPQFSMASGGSVLGPLLTMPTPAPAKP